MLSPGLQGYVRYRIILFFLVRWLSKWTRGQQWKLEWGMENKNILARLGFISFHLFLRMHTPHVSVCVCLCMFSTFRCKLQLSPFDTVSLLSSPPSTPSTVLLSWKVNYSVLVCPCFQCSLPLGQHSRLHCSVQMRNQTPNSRTVSHQT